MDPSFLLNSTAFMSFSWHTKSPFPPSLLHHMIQKLLAMWQNEYQNQLQMRYLALVTFKILFLKSIKTLNFLTSSPIVYEYKFGNRVNAILSVYLLHKLTNKCIAFDLVWLFIQHSTI